MREPRRVALIKVSLQKLTEVLRLDDRGVIVGAECNRVFEGGPLFLAGRWRRPSAVSNAELVRQPMEVAGALHLPGGTEIVDAWTVHGEDVVVLKLEGPALAPVMRNQRVPEMQLVVDTIPQPAGLAPLLRGRLEGAA